MAKWSADTNMDAMLNEISTCNELVVCSGQPANYAGVAADRDISFGLKERD